ncbi:MAG: hypothetical protein RIQ93_89 [Verrucomicrobiota bacterium]|jgi:hypothetical protein
MRFRVVCALTFPLWAFAANAPDAPSATITFVANAENLTRPRVRYTGKAWVVDRAGFLAGSGRGHRLMADVTPGNGDFRAEFELSLPAAARESSVVIGADGELVIAAAARQWKLRGRFFRAGDAPIAFAAPAVKAGQRFVLVIERQGAEVAIAVDRVVMYRGACRAGPTGALGLDPGAGAVRLYQFATTGAFPASGFLAKPFGNPFGMQLRPAPSNVEAVQAPVIVRAAATNETSLVRRRDGALEIYSVTKPASDSISVQRSADGGLTWSEPQVAFPLPGRAYYAVQALEAGDGALHVVAHLGGEGPGGYRGRLYEVYHAKRPAGSVAWSSPQRVVPGYVGSIRGFIALHRNGRLLLAVGRAMPGREAPPASGPDLGWNDTFVYFSDDQGATWRQSPDALSVELKTPNATRYGAIEPVLLELRDGRVWMLVRDRQGRLWQSFSADGARWAPLERTTFISSDSPAALLRLRDGRIILLTNACQNWTDPRSYAMGGREVLHAAISADEGKTWRGFREILHETVVVSGGDRGTAYASLAENTAGKVVVVSGQGEANRAIVMFDPGWLERRSVQDELVAGPVAWTQYGDDGLRVDPVEGGARVVAVPLKATGFCGALWNFPIGEAGELRARIQLPARSRAVRLSLNDHFNRIDDRQAAAHAVFTIEAESVNLRADKHWHDLTLKWSGAQARGELDVTVDGQPPVRLSAQRAAQFGVNYLRVEFRGDSDDGRVLISDLSVRLP